MSLRNAILLLSLAAASYSAPAQNPVIRDQFSADPTARVFNDRMYLYPSHDIPGAIDKLKEWFCMADYHVFSSDNLCDWTDHGVIVSQDRVPWVDAGSYTMWAPDCVRKGDMYYFYFPAAPNDGERGFKVGVALSHSPEGPFMPMRKPIDGINGIDPCVLVDDDGASYIYWAGMGLRGARLADDMMSLASEPVLVGGLPEGFKEGPFVFKRAGKYYFTFPWVQDKTETLAYAMGDSPLGPFEFKGLIMDQWPDGCWTNHHSIVEWRGGWYLFYHHNDYSPDFDKNRSVRIDTLAFNDDGTIRNVTPTLRGVGVSDARRRIHIDRYSDISPKLARVDFIDPADRFRGWKTVMSRRGAWVRYDRVDFGARPVTHVTARVKSPSGGTLEVYAGSMDADGLLASMTLPRSGRWTDVTLPVTAAPTGAVDLFVRLAGGKGVEVDWIGFDALPWETGAFDSGMYRNLFSEAGYDEADISRRLYEIYDSLFHGPDKIYFEVGDSMAYISDIKNRDVRTEGMSYGMMVAVQLDKKDVFDRLWRWSRRYMQHQSGDREGYFAWSCRTDGTRNSHGAASDGELYFITSLIFASNRWGNDSGINYLAEAQRIVDQSMLKTGKTHAAPLINLEHRLITFTPDNYGGTFTDPSYHVPAFYEVWARYLDDGRSGFWLDCAKRSREYLHACVHPVTGLTPDYSAYDGSLMGRKGILGDAFRFDSWRVPMNIALDYSWSCADGEWQRDYANRFQGFLYSRGIDDFKDQYNIDGSDVERVLDAGGYRTLRHSLGLVATSAAASLASTDMTGREFVRRLWEARHEPYDDGYFDAYYDGLLRLFAFMHLSGNYRIITPR